MKEVTPVLLAGGSGTRLWPLSRKSYPKQFAKLTGEYSLFQQSAQRLTSSEIVQFTRPMTLTNEDFRFIVGEQLQTAGIETDEIVIEPEGKNTGPAILAASLVAYNKNPEAIILAAPSDHVIANVQSFHRAIKDGMSGVEQGSIVTLGVKPTRPETGYGYILVKNENLGEELFANGCAPVEKFAEKPDAETAKEYFESKEWLWNAGIFLFKARDMIDAMKAHRPDVLDHVKRSVRAAKRDLDFLRLGPGAWLNCPDISLDYAVLEKIDNLVTVPFMTSGWSDLGDWKAVWEEQGPDKEGNVTSDNALAIDCKGSLLRSENEAQQVVGLGLEDIVAVAMSDAVLIAHKDRTQDVKKVVATLKEQGTPQAEVFPKDHRPWGWFESLVIGDRFQVKRIHVHPGAALSLQSHHHRSEHWIVVEGTAEVTVGDKVKLVTEGESIYIPLGAKHRMKNPGKLPMLLIEVQTGAYLGEDDIIRYEDVYSRT